MPIVIIVLGLLLLFFGRSLYWAFVAVAGFLMGLELAADLLADQPRMIQILAAIAAGVLGAVIGVVAQRVAFAIGGFFAGGYLALSLVDRLPEASQSNLWFIVGGVIGAIIAALVLDWAIIVLSSIAVAVMSPFALRPELHVLAMLGLAVLGVVAQGSRLRGPRAELPPPQPA